MEFSESGYSYIYRTEDGEAISPRKERYYFNFGNYCVTEESTNVPKPTTERCQLSGDIANQVGNMIKVKRYKKPKTEHFLLDAPSSSYTFYFFDGQRMHFDAYLMGGEDKMLIVDNAYEIEKLLKQAAK